MNGPMQPRYFAQTATCAACATYLPSQGAIRAHFENAQAKPECLAQEGNWRLDIGSPYHYDPRQVVGRVIAKNPNTPLDVLSKLTPQFPAEVLANPALELLELEDPNAAKIRAYSYDNLMQQVVRSARRTSDPEEQPAPLSILRWAAHCEVLAWRPNFEVAYTEVYQHTERDSAVVVLVWGRYELNVVYVAPWAHQLLVILRHLRCLPEITEVAQRKQQYELLQAYLQPRTSYDRVCFYHRRHANYYHDRTDCRWHEAYYHRECVTCNQGEPACDLAPMQWTAPIPLSFAIQGAPSYVQQPPKLLDVPVDHVFGVWADTAKDRFHKGVYPYGSKAPFKPHRKLGELDEARARHIDRERFNSALL